MNWTPLIFFKTQQHKLEPSLGILVVIPCVIEGDCVCTKPHGAQGF